MWDRSLSKPCASGCSLSRVARADRKLVVVGPGQFALIDWGLPEDPEAIAALERPDEPADEKPLRSKERHPPVSKAGGTRGDASSKERSSQGRNKKKETAAATRHSRGGLAGRGGRERQHRLALGEGSREGSDER